MTSRVHHAVLSLGLTLAMGFAFTPLGCGSSIPPAVSVPSDADLSRQLRACAAEHEEHLGYAPRSMSFDVTLTDAGDVDSVALRDESFRDESLEACMVRALRSLTLDDLPMRLSSSRPPGPVAPESRAFLGQANPPVDIPLELGLEACLKSPPCAIGLGVIVGASLIAVTVYIYVNTNHSPVRPRPPIMLATSLPMATAIPTATAPPIATTVPGTQAETYEEKKERCKQVLEDCIVACRATLPTYEWSGDRFFRCKRNCLRSAGCP